MGREAKIVQIDSSATFESGDSLQALFCGSFGPAVVPLVHCRAFLYSRKTKLYGYADDSTLVAIVPSPGERVAVSESMNRYLNRVSVWCDMWEMKLNVSKTKTMIVSRSRTVQPQLTPLTLEGTVLKESAVLLILGVTFDAKMTFEKHLRYVSSAAAQRLGIMRKSWQVFHDQSLLLRSFWSFVLLVLEYIPAVWCSAADSHLKLLDRVVRSAGFLAGGVLECNLANRRSVAGLRMLFKIKSKPMHP